MPLLKSVERTIANVEGFEVTVRHATGRDMRSDKEGLPSYPYQKAAKNDFTVAQWRDQRFRQVFAGYEVTVWLADGSEAHGVTRLSTVRDSYLEE
ncbi:MAG: hypothetical protein AB1505_25225 [Candidatus Latescibacterota bacterium]